MEDEIQDLSSTGWWLSFSSVLWCRRKNKDNICHCSSFKLSNLPAIVSSFALSDKGSITSKAINGIGSKKEHNFVFNV